MQVLADDVFGGGGGHRLAKSDADDAVEILRTVHAFRSVAIAAAPETLYVERHDLRFGAFDSLGVVQRELGNKRGLRNFAFGENHDDFALEEGAVNLFHGFAWVAAVDVDERFAVREPAQVPVRKGVPVTRDEERARACHLEHCPVDKAEVRPHQKKRSGFGNVLDSSHLDLVAEHECESETEPCAQERHRGALEREHERECENHGEEEQLLVETQLRHEEEDDLETEQYEQECHLNHERHGVDAARSVRTRDVLDDRAENDERGTRPECDERIETSENVLVVDERRHDHRDGCCNGRDGDEPCFNKVLGRFCSTDGADDVGDTGKDKRPLEKCRVLRSRHVLRNHDDELRDAPKRRNAKHREPEHGV